MDKIQVTIETIHPKKIISKKTGDEYRLHEIKAGDGRTYESFIGKWNAHWKPGDIVEGMYYANEYNGKVTHQLKAPPEFRQSFGGGSSGFDDGKLTEVLNNQLKIMDSISKIESRIGAIENKLSGEPDNWNDDSIVSKKSDSIPF